MKGDEIIEALIANSATYEKKTTFSQVSLMLEWMKFCWAKRALIDMLMYCVVAGEI